MKGYLSTMLFCLAVRLTTADPQCDMGKQIVDKVDNRIFNGGWKAKYVMPASFSKQNGRCWESDYTPSADGNYRIAVSAKSPQSGETLTATGSTRIVEDRNMEVTFSENSTDSELAGLTGKYSVLAWDEDEGFLIAGGCSPINNNKPLAWIAYRQYPPSQDSLEASKAALKKTGLKLEDFDENCE